MSEKKAKQLRRDANYHPTDPRKYTQVRTNTPGITMELDPSYSRSLYQELKKKAKNGTSND